MKGRGREHGVLWVCLLTCASEIQHAYDVRLLISICKAVETSNQCTMGCEVQHILCVGLADETQNAAHDVADDRLCQHQSERMHRNQSLLLLTINAMYVFSDLLCKRRGHCST